MNSWAHDAIRSFVEGLLDLIDAFARLSPRTYLITASIVAIVCAFSLWGPHV